MSGFFAAARRAVVAHLSGASLGAAVTASPPANFAQPIVFVGKITADTPESPTEAGGWHMIEVSIWVQSHSPLQLDTISDAVQERLDGARLFDSAASFSSIDLTASDDMMRDGDAPGGPVVGRIQTYRVFIQ